MACQDIIYKRVVMPGDGDCMFHAVAYGSTYTARQLREMAANYLSTHNDVNGISIDDVTKTEGMTKKAYCSSIQSGRLWGGALECGALAEALSYRIKIFGKSKKGSGFVQQAVFTGSNWTTERPLRRLLRDGSHYDVLAGQGRLGAQQ